VPVKLYVELAREVLKPCLEGVKRFKGIEKLGTVKALVVVGRLWRVLILILTLPPLPVFVLNVVPLRILFNNLLLDVSLLVRESSLTPRASFVKGSFVKSKARQISRYMEFPLGRLIRSINVFLDEVFERHVNCQVLYNFADALKLLFINFEFCLLAAGVLACVC